MNFLLFILYYLICTVLFGFIVLFVYRFIVHRKCSVIERTAEKAIDDYFNAYDQEYSSSHDSFFPRQFGSSSSQEKK